MKVELTLETVTPLFLGGAEQQPDVRPASVRGALRYWLRAAMGGVLGDDQVGEIARIERKIFGATDAGSPVIVRFLSDDNLKNKKPLLPHRNLGITDAWSEGKKFKLILALTPAAQLQANADDILEMALWATLLWLTLGGLGRRARRGAGAFKIVSYSVPDEVFTQEMLDCLRGLKTNTAMAVTLAQEIGRLVKNALDSFDKFADPDTNPNFHSYVLHPILRDETRIVVWTPNAADPQNAAAALSVLMEKMSGTKRALGGRFSQAFGGVEPRFASPLHVAIHQLNNQWAFVMTYLGSETWQEGQQQHREVKSFFDGLGNTIDAWGSNHG